MFVQETAKEVVEVYYKELFDMFEKYDVEVDLEDWITEKTHFVYCVRVGQWEAHTLELLSETNELGDIEDAK